MKKRQKLLIMRLAAAVVTVSSIYLFAPWQFALYYLYPLPSSIQAQADQAIEQGLDGIIIYVDKKGQPPEQYASGWHDRQRNIPAYPDALFKIASIAKLYDAAAVTKLAASGRLSLDKTLAYYLPNFRERIEYADQITLRMMVQHQSGIPNFTDHKDYNWGEASLDVLSLTLDQPADFAPGQKYAYSNSNYLLLSMVMTKVLGYSYTQFIQEQLLSPLNIERTYFSVHEVNQDDLMSGYYVGNPNDFKSLDQGYIATAQDVGTFLRGLNEGTFFNDKEKQIYASLYEYEHTGWVLGYLSIARYHRDLDTVVIQFVNTNGNDTVLLNEIIYQRVVDILAIQSEKS